MPSNFFWTLSTNIVPLLIVIVLHEMAHGYAALFFGDKTAKRQGRLSFNPKVHFELFGSFLLPAFLYVSHVPFMIGWAKPVPVNFSALNNPKKDMGIVAMAGPLMNFLLTILFSFGVALLQPVSAYSTPIEWVYDALKAGANLSLVLCAFNLLPILPLDGGRILSSILPKHLAIKYDETEKYGFFILIGLLILGNISDKFDILGLYINWIYGGLLRIIHFIF